MRPTLAIDRRNLASAWAPVCAVILTASAGGLVADEPDQAEQLRRAAGNLAAEVPKEKRLTSVLELQRLDTEEAARLLARTYAGNLFRSDEFEDAIAGHWKSRGIDRQSCRSSSVA